MLTASSRRWVTALGVVFFAFSALGSGRLRRDKGGADGVELLATSKSSYVGNWEGIGVALRIAPDGTVGYEKKTGAFKKSVNGKLSGFEGDSIVVNALLNVTLNVDEPPSESGGVWTMKVEGTKLRRIGDGSAESNDIDERLEAHILERFGEQKGLAKVDCPDVEPSTPSFECQATLVNGRRAKVSVKHESRGNYAYTVHVTDVKGPVFAAELTQTIRTRTKRKITIVCSDKIFVPNEEPFTCDAIEGRKQGTAEFKIDGNNVDWKLTGL